jgi:hypothetical protein
MEFMQDLHQDSTRDSDTMDLDVTGTGDVESFYHGGEHFEGGGSAKMKTIQTKGLFNFMELPAEIRVNVCGLT